MTKLLRVGVYVVLSYVAVNLLLALYGNLFMNGAVHGTTVLLVGAVFCFVVLLTAIYEQLRAVQK